MRSKPGLPFHVVFRPFRADCGGVECSTPLRPKSGLPFHVVFRPFRADRGGVTGFNPFAPEARTTLSCRFSTLSRKPQRRSGFQSELSEYNLSELRLVESEFK